MNKALILKRIGIGLVIVFVIIVIIVGGLFAFSSTLAGSALPPLQLPQLSSAPQDAGTASPDGTWVAGDGSMAGFRVGVGQRSTIVGRTSAITGLLVISHNEISSGSFQVDLGNITIDGKQNASFFELLETSNYPKATLTLTQPIILPSTSTNGLTISLKAPATLAVHGITRTITLDMAARYEGSELEAAGSAPFLASNWNVKSPFAVHKDGLVEFYIVLQRR